MSTYISCLTMCSLDSFLNRLSFTEDNGATLFVPKSHRMSLHDPSDIHKRNTKFLQSYSKKDEDESNETRSSGASGKEALDAQLLDKAVKAIMPRGSVMFYAGSLYHCGGQNTTEKTRLGVILEYVASWLRPVSTTPILTLRHDGKQASILTPSRSK